MLENNITIKETKYALATGIGLVIIGLEEFVGMVGIKVNLLQISLQKGGFGMKRASFMLRRIVFMSALTSRCLS